MIDFEELKELINAHRDKFDVGTPASADAVDKAQHFLELSFPDSYVLYLKTWGTVAIGPLEFYGITGTVFDNSKVPNGIWFTQAKRQQLGLPKELIVILDNNGDEYYCVDSRNGNIVIWAVKTKSVTAKKAENIFRCVIEEAKDWL